MQRALISGIILGALLAVLGVFVVLRRMAFFADGIAHASLVGVAIGVLASVNPVIVALLVAIFFTVVIFFLEKRYRFSSDTSIGIIFTSGMALGVLLMSLKSGYQPELISFLFGNILAITNLEMWLIVCLSLIIFVFIFVNLRRIVLLSFDRDSAYISGIRVDMLQLSTNIFLAVSVVLGIKVLGIVLVSALLLIPVATAKIFSNSFKKLLIFSLIISELTVILGLIVSYFLDLPTGPVIVLAGTLIFILVAIIKRKKL